MGRDSGTRSGMLWQVERILDELKDNNMELPQVLLMENVPEVKGTNNVDYFNEWQLKLEQLGYKNYHQNLIATDYGIPQTRNRTFMISILGDYSYTFPNSIPLKLKLKDLLENEVDEKYYLTSKQLKQISNWNAYEKPLDHLDDELVGTLTTRSGDMTSSIKLVKDTENYIEWYEKGKLEMECRAYREEKVGPTLHTKSGNIKILVKEATKQGYAIATPGDSINISQPNSKTRRGRVGKGVAQILLTQPEQCVIGTYNFSYSDNFMQGKDRLNKDTNTMPTILTTPKIGVAYKNLRIRKLTPKECFRLMGVKDEDFERIAMNQSDSSLYHLAGDSIVVNVLMAIFKEMM